MNKEQTALRARIDRELMALDQKIERQDAIIAAATEASADLHAARDAMLASAIRLRGDVA